ncbi:MAG: hypothetical protein U9N85_02580 [Bacteroidota bacterium]|nr:hypothetical protein [Bacteroidota bacterium]
MNLLKFLSFFAVSIILTLSLQAQQRAVNENGNYKGTVRIKIDETIGY